MLSHFYFHCLPGIQWGQYQISHRYLLLHPRMLKECKKSHCIAPEKGFSSQNKAILIHNVATCPWYYGFSYRAVEMGKDRNCLWKEQDFEIRELQAVSLCTHGLYSPSPGNECMQPAEFNSLLVYYYLKIQFFVSPSTEASPSNRTYKKYTQ